MNVLQNSTVFLLQDISSGANYSKIGHSENSSVCTKVLGEEKGLICMGKPNQPVIPCSLYVVDIACEFTCSWGLNKKEKKNKSHFGFICSYIFK